MSEPEDHGEVTYLSEVIAKIDSRIRRAGEAALKTLPGRRRKLIPPLEEAATLLKSVAEVLERSGMGDRLGFIKVDNGIKPVMMKAKEVGDAEGRPDVQVGD